MTCVVCSGDNFTFVGEGRGYKLVRCEDCGFRVISPLPSPEELNAFYGSYSAQGHLYDKKIDKKVARATKRVKRYAHLAKGRKFIDIGCSVGTAVAAAQSQGFEAYGIDLDTQSIDFARRTFPKAKFHAGPVEDVPAEWGQFDFIYTSEVIEHLLDPHLLLDTIEKIATPDALLYITAPDSGHFMVPRDFFTWQGFVPPEHLNYFTKDHMRRLLDAHGFDVLKIELSMKPGIKAVARRRPK
tara:strand:+ start:2653 stop:3375 length:723 start_codon:yes stop_codon:yes gene_type:complete